MKAAGPDDLKPVVLQHIGDEALTKITNFFKRSMMSSFIPQRWRQMKVVFIPKLGKDDYSVPKAYRPITLSNFLPKVMERVINWFLSERVIALPLPNQHAYTRGLGRDGALVLRRPRGERIPQREKIPRRQPRLLGGFRQNKVLFCKGGP